MADATLSPAEIAAALAELPGWSVVDGHLHRAFEFADFTEAFGFMARVAVAAEKLDHHPDWSNAWNRVVVDIVSHDAGGITQRCVRLAASASRAAA